MKLFFRIGPFFDRLNIKMISSNFEDVWRMHLLIVLKIRKRHTLIDFSCLLERACTFFSLLDFDFNTRKKCAFNRLYQSDVTKYQKRFFLMILIDCKLNFFSYYQQYLKINHIQLQVKVFVLFDFFVFLKKVNYMDENVWTLFTSSHRPTVLWSEKSFLLI